MDLRRADGALVLVTYRGDWCPYCCGQMVRLANADEAVQGAGGEIVAVSVDSPGRNEAMRRRWHLPFPIVSDPDGERLLKPLELFSPEERDGIAWPATVVFAPDGTEVSRRRARDVADRGADESVAEVVSRLGLPSVTLGPAPAAAEPEEDRSAFRADALGAYFRGMRSGTGALSARLDGTNRDEARAVSTMAASFVEAWRERRDAVERASVG